MSQKLSKVLNGFLKPNFFKKIEEDVVKVKNPEEQRQFDGFMKKVGASTPKELLKAALLLLKEIAKKLEIGWELYLIPPKGNEGEKWDIGDIQKLAEQDPKSICSLAMGIQKKAVEKEERGWEIFLIPQTVTKKEKIIQLKVINK